MWEVRAGRVGESNGEKMETIIKKIVLLSQTFNTGYLIMASLKLNI